MRPEGRTEGRSGVFPGSGVGTCLGSRADHASCAVAGRELGILMGFGRSCGGCPDSGQSRLGQTGGQTGAQTLGAFRDTSVSPGWFALSDCAWSDDAGQMKRADCVRRVGAGLLRRAGGAGSCAALLCHRIGPSASCGQMPGSCRSRSVRRDRSWAGPARAKKAMAGDVVLHRPISGPRHRIRPGPRPRRAPPGDRTGRAKDRSPTTRPRPSCARPPPRPAFRGPGHPPAPCRPPGTAAPRAA